jgi:Fic family protein
MMELKLIPQNLKESVMTEFFQNLDSKFVVLQDAPISKGEFSFYTSVASVYSSKLEGEEIELDSYIKHRGWGISFEPDYTKRIDQLYSAYQFAQANPLNEINIAQAHSLLAESLLPTHHRGRLRLQNMYVTNSEGQIEYVAPEPNELEKEMGKFYSDLDVLLKSDLSVNDVFYYAAFLHLIFVKIHPWSDGNGRSARLIEKWFVAEKLGEKAWFLQSEKYYFENKDLYYQFLKNCGLEYQNTDWSRAVPFLQMLPKSL